MLIFLNYVRRNVRKLFLNTYTTLYKPFKKMTKKESFIRRFRSAGKGYSLHHQRAERASIGSKNKKDHCNANYRGLTTSDLSAGLARRFSALEAEIEAEKGGLDHD